MLLMGDEVRRTQQGNNNAYCQDNATSWFDWDDVARHADIRRFARGLIHFHQDSAIFRDRTFWGEPGATKITWHGVKLNQPEWDDESHSLAFELFHAESAEHLHVMLNDYWEPLTFELPAPADGPSVAAAGRYGPRVAAGFLRSAGAAGRRAGEVHLSVAIDRSCW